jgi:hypothetical protein
VYNISQVYYKIRPNYVMFCLGESVTLRSILQDIRVNDIGFHDGKDTLILATAKTSSRKR